MIVCRRIAIAMLLLDFGMLVFSLPRAAFGLASTHADATDIEVGRRVLREQADLPWYDPGNDKLKRIDVEQPEDDTDRKSKWSSTLEGKPAEADSAERRVDSLFWDLMQALAWALLGLLLAWLIWQLIRATRRMRSSRKSDALKPATQVGADRLEDLPMPIPKTEPDLLAAARRLADAGEFGEAIKFLFSYHLLELDQHRCIELTRGKTNRQYLRELQSRPQLRDLLGRTMIPFEDAFFGHHRLSRETFQVCWDDLTRFRQALEQLAS